MVRRNVVQKDQTPPPITVNSRDLLLAVCQCLNGKNERINSAELEPHHPELWVRVVLDHGARVQVCLEVKDVQA